MLQPAELSCGHIFEEVIVRRWLGSHPLCPLHRCVIQPWIRRVEGLEADIHAFIRDHPQLLDGKSITALQEELTTQIDLVDQEEDRKYGEGRCKEYRGERAAHMYVRYHRESVSWDAAEVFEAWGRHHAVFQQLNDDSGSRMFSLPEIPKTKELMFYHVGLISA